MEKVKGYEIRLEVKGVQAYAEQLLILHNWKSSGHPIYDIRTVPFSDFFIVTCSESAVESIKRGFSEYIDLVEEVRVLEINTEDDLTNRASHWLDEEIMDLEDDRGVVTFLVD